MNSIPQVKVGISCRQRDCFRNPFLSAQKARSTLLKFGAAGIYECPVYRGRIHGTGSRA